MDVSNEELPVEGYVKGWNGAWHFRYKNTPTDAIVELVEESMDSEPPRKRTKRTGESSATTIPSSSAAFHVHTNALKRSAYFAKAMELSTEHFEPLERRQGKLVLRLVKDPEISVTTYLDCFMLLYHEYICTSDFISISRTLELLKVGLQIMFDAGINRCYDFLSGVDWTQQEGQEIQELFLNRELIPRDDLVAKMILVNGDKEGIKAMVDAAMKTVTTGALQQKLNDSSNVWWERLGNVVDTRSEAPTFALGTLGSLRGENLVSSGPSCREMILTEWSKNCKQVVSDAQDSLTMRERRSYERFQSWLNTFHLLLDANIADVAIEMFCRDRDLITAAYRWSTYLSDRNTTRSVRLLDLIHRIFQMVAQGRVVFGRAAGDAFSIPSSLLFDLWDTWGWTMLALGHPDHLATFAAAFSKLPFVEQSIFLSARFSFQYEHCFHVWLSKAEQLRGKIEGPCWSAVL